MRLIFSLIFLLSINTVCFASTNWYLRDGGGPYGTNSTSCNGLTNAVFTGSNGPNCALNSPGWIVGSNNTGSGQTPTTAKWVGSDTIFINGDSDINPGQQAKYIMGYGMANAGYYCSTAAQGGNGPTYAANCQMLNMPAGVSGNPTSIIGTGTHKPLIYNSFSNYVIILANNNYINLQWLEITDLVACAANDPVQGCNSVGNFVTDGIQTSGTGNTYTDLYIHGVGRFGINGNGVFGNATFTRVWLIGNGYGGANMGSDGNEAFTGTLIWNQPIIEWNGCVEAYPMTNAGIDNPLNYSNCFGQISGGYGDGLAYGALGNENAGNWSVIGPGSISFNTQDGLDLLHGTTGTSIDNVDKMRFEGNAGQQVKITGLTDNITNNVIIGNCGWWYEAPQSVPGGMGLGDVCRASGSTIRFNVTNGSVSNFYSNTIITNEIALESTDGDGTGCNGSTQINEFNNVIQGGYSWNDDSNFVPGGGDSQTTHTYNDGNNGAGGGTCGNLIFNEDYNIIYGNKNSNGQCSGSHDKCGTVPGFAAGIFPAGTYQGPLTSFYRGQAGVSLVTLGVSSAALGSGVPGLIYWNTPNDFYNTVRLNPPSMGAIEYQSCGVLDYGCQLNSDCCTGICSSNQCAGSCSAVGTSCVLNSDCCSDICTSGTCSTGSCTSNGGACSLNSSCCSGICCSSICATSCGGSSTGIINQIIGQCSTVGKTGF